MRQHYAGQISIRANEHSIIEAKEGKRTSMLAIFLVRNPSS